MNDREGSDHYRPKFGQPRGFGFAGPRRFWKTVAGPGMTAYPEDGQDPPVNVYYVQWQKSPSYEETPGAQTFATLDVDSFGYILNLCPQTYIEEGSKGIAFFENGQYYTVDKVPGGFVTHRKYDVDGNLLWSKDHGIRVFGINVDSSDNVYVIGENAPTDGAYVRRYDSSGALTLSIANPGYGSTTGDVIADSAGNILAIDGVGVVRKYNSSGSLVWTSNSGDVSAACLALGSSDSYYTTGASLKHFNSSGTFQASGTGGGHRVSCRVSESTVHNSGGGSTSSRRYDLTLGTEFTVYRGPSASGVDHTGSAVWLSQCGGSAFATDSVAKLTVTGSIAYTWEITRRGGVAFENDLSLFDVDARVLVAGTRHSAITHQARDASTGTLLWEADHGDTVYACAGFSSGVVIGGARVKA